MAKCEICGCIVDSYNDEVELFRLIRKNMCQSCINQFNIVALRHPSIKRTKELCDLINTSQAVIHGHIPSMQWINDLNNLKKELRQLYEERPRIIEEILNQCRSQLS